MPYVVSSTPRERSTVRFVVLLHRLFDRFRISNHHVRCSNAVGDLEARASHQVILQVLYDVD